MNIISAAIAQLAEHPLSKRKVVGSSPTGGSLLLLFYFFLILLYVKLKIQIII